jgi:uncharacterized protein YifN (PemK superfamily)
MPNDYQDDDDDIEGDDEPFLRLPAAPDRGRIIIVNFELGGGGVGQEMRKPGRPCLVIQNNAIRRGRLVTVVPLSGAKPLKTEPLEPYHHLMDHRSFLVMPKRYGGQAKQRWAKCDYVTTVSLDRCTNPYAKEPYKPRKYVTVKAIKADVEAVEKCMLWALGIKLPNP